MNLLDILLLALIGLALLLALRQLRRSRGRCSCGGNCSCCAQNCRSKPQEKSY